MWERLQRYRALDPQARRLFRSAVLFLPLIRISLRFRGYKKTQHWLKRRLVSNTQPASSRESAELQLLPACRMVTAAAHYGLIRPTCLEESLALWYFLRKLGFFPKLRIGVRKQDGRFEAHAWVEHDGQSLNQLDELHKHYAAFDNEFSDPPVSLT